MLHLLTAVPEGVWGRYLDVARRRAPSPPLQPTSLAEQILPASPDESHAHATRTAFLLALALAAKPQPTPAWGIQHAGPRIVALAHALIANASVIGIPPAPLGLLRTIRSEVNAIALATHNQSHVPSALDIIGSIFDAVQRGDRDTAATMVTRHWHWLTTDARMRLAMAGLGPFPTTLSPQEAGELLAAGWWEPQWAACVDQCSDQDLTLLARAMAAHPQMWTDERVQRVARDHTAAATLWRDCSALRTHPDLMVAIVDPRHSDILRDVLFRQPEWHTHPLLIEAATRHPTTAESLLIMFPDLRTQTALLDAVACNPYSAYQVLLRCAELHTHPDLLDAVMRSPQAPQMITTILSTYPDLCRRTDLIDIIARDPHAAADALARCPDVRDRQVLIESAARSPKAAAVVLVNVPEFRDQRVWWETVTQDTNAFLWVLSANQSIYRTPFVLAMLRESATFRRLVNAAGMHPVWWHALSPDERVAWAEQQGVDPSVVDWLTARATSDPISWTRKDVALIRRHAVLRPLLRWAVTPPPTRKRKRS